MTSLRDLNLRLKGKNINTKINRNRNPIVFQIWVKRNNKMEFFTEASTLNKYNNRWPKNKCPYCTEKYGNKNKTKEDTVSWIFKCPGCGSTLEVYKE